MTKSYAFISLASLACMMAGTVQSKEPIFRAEDVAPNHYGHGRGYRRANIKLENATKAPARFMLYYTDPNNNVAPLKVQDLNGDNTAENASVVVAPGTSMYFVYGNYDFKNAMNQKPCIAQVDVQPLDAAGKDVGVKLYKRPTRWCKAEIQDTLIYGGFQAWRALLSLDKQGDPQLTLNTRQY